VFDGEQAIGSDKAVQSPATVLEIGCDQWNGVGVGARLARDLAEDEIVPGQVGNHERWSAFAGLQVGLRKRQNNDLASYRLPHAVSSSGVFQSLPNADSLRSNRSSSILRRRKLTKS
jgi:hypothetical protein